MSDRLDKFLEIGGSFDWITPLVSLLSRGNVTYKVHKDNYPIVQMRLQRAGIRPRNVNITGNTAVFDVKRDEAEKVDLILR